MRNDPVSWFKGSVEIEIKGRFNERFLNLAFQENIELTGIRREGSSIYARVSLEQIPRLRAIARRSRCTFRICRREGMPFVVAFLRKRPLLPAMAALAIFLFVFVSSFIFTLDVGGPYALSDEDKQTVLTLAEEAGLKTGRCRWGMDMEDVKTHIRSGFPELIFVEIDERGVHLTIEVVKRVDVTEEQAIKAPGNMVAICDGIIENVLVRRGIAAVAPGDAVCAGEILIYGYDGKQGLAADGIVTARLWGEGYGECATEMKGEKLSGNTALSLGFRIGEGGYIHLLGAARSPYEKYQQEETVYNSIMGRNTGMTVEIISRKYREVVTFFQSYTPEEALQQARTTAAQNAYEQLVKAYAYPVDGNLQVVEENTEDIDLGDGLARAHTVLEGLAEIGEYRRATEERYIPEEISSPNPE